MWTAIELEPGAKYNVSIVIVQPEDPGKSAPPIGIRRGDLAKASGVDALRCVDAKHVDGQDIPEHVGAVAEEIVGTEQARKMPEQAVVMLEQPFDQRLRARLPIVLHIEIRLVPGQGVHAPLEDIELHAFDVDLDQMTLRDE